MAASEQFVWIFVLWASSVGISKAHLLQNTFHEDPQMPPAPDLGADIRQKREGSNEDNEVQDPKMPPIPDIIGRQKRQSDDAEGGSELGETEKLISAWQAAEMEKDAFYAANPNSSLEPDPNSDVQLEFVVIKAEAAEIIDDPVMFEDLEKHTVQDRQGWEAVEEERKEYEEKKKPFDESKSKKLRNGQGKIQQEKKKKERKQKQENEFLEGSGEVGSGEGEGGEGGSGEGGSGEGGSGGGSGDYRDEEIEDDVIDLIADSFTDAISKDDVKRLEKDKIKSLVDDSVDIAESKDAGFSIANAVQRGLAFLGLAGTNGRKKRQAEGDVIVDDIGNLEDDDRTDYTSNKMSKRTRKNRKKLCPKRVLTKKSFKIKNPKANSKAGQQNGSDKPNVRKKRMVLKNEKWRWDYGMLPFVIEDKSLSDTYVREIYRSMDALEKFTCIRFVPWVSNATYNTNDDLGLGHPSYLRFVTDTKPACWSYQGNQRWEAGQKIKCFCGGKSCVHELGHALGIQHEHQSPARDGWIRVNEENIAESNRWGYKQLSTDAYQTYGYDITSLMHYNQRGPYLGKPTYTMLFPELKQGSDIFYLFMEVALSHSCAATFCSDFIMTCQNDGFVSLVEGECACLCPYGLDPENGCTTIKKPNPTYTFPGGQYALPMAIDGCPNARFKTGLRIHHGDGQNGQRSNKLKGTISGTTAEHNFCVNDGGYSETDISWPSGDYCIYRKGETCPDNFVSGWVQYVDTPHDNLSPSSSGILPGGVFNDTVTKFEFCCRRDGYASEYVEFPAGQPFALYKFSSDCQNIFGMRHEIGKIGFDNYQLGSVVASREGDNPISYIKGSTQLYWTNHCYYTPLNMDCGGVIELTKDNPTATISSSGGANLECSWLVKARENDKILIGFDEFNIAGTDGNCIDSIDLRHVRIGQPGFVLCGTKPEAMKSFYNNMMLTFRTMTGSTSSFTATVKLIDSTDMCYNLADQGATYGGVVNFTRDFKPCLDWANVTSCPHHKFSPNDLKDNLDVNYCRNPGNGFMPWCYTNLDGCERNYCDVCGKVPRYDVFTDCEYLKTIGYCKTNLEAISTCAKTCEDELPAVDEPVRAADVSCGVPELMPDGVLSTVAKDSYNVGEIITYQCLTSETTLDRTCMTTGTWSPAEYVCRECREGWFNHNGNCYGFIDELLYYSEAQEMCSDYNGVIATAKDADENEFVHTIRNYHDTSATIWLGLSDELVEGQWIWSDGEDVTWTNWVGSEPDNYAGSQNCGNMRTDGTWRDSFCGNFYKYRVVCKSPEFDAPCQDFWFECPDMYYDNPPMCSTYSAVTKLQCKFTCGFCDESYCHVEPPQANTTLLSNATTIRRGDYVTYACAEGYSHISGDAIRGCQFCGDMTGEPFVCMGDDVAITTMDSPEPISLPTVGSSYRAITGENDNFRITRNGRVFAWEFWANYPGKVWFQIWRAKPSMTTDSHYYFEFRGQNEVQAGSNRLQTYEVPEAERIEVQAGDLIGMYFGDDKAGIGYKWCQETVNPEAKDVAYLNTKLYSADKFSTGTDYKFSNFLTCRTFSFRGVIGPK